MHEEEQQELSEPRRRRRRGMLFWLHFYSLISFSFPLFVTKQVCLSSDHTTHHHEQIAVSSFFILGLIWLRITTTNDDHDGGKNGKKYTRRKGGRKRGRTSEGGWIKEIQNWVASQELSNWKETGWEFGLFCLTLERWPHHTTLLLMPSLLLTAWEETRLSETHITSSPKPKY